MTSYDKLAPDELQSALELLLAPPGGDRALARTLVAGFCDYLRAGNLSWDGWRSGPTGGPTALFLAVLLPGHTALVFIPQPDENGIDPGVQLDSIRTALAELAARRLHYAQALLERDAHSKRELLRQAGFQALAPLTYLERSVTFPWVEPPSAAGLEWLPFDDRTRPEFARTILASYQDSLDCPELTGIRPIDDILAAHQAAGRFNSALWELAVVDGEPGGCLLLAQHVHTPLVEVVYTGVVPAWRRRGVGGWLLQRAIEQGRAVQARRLSVVVDSRNAPAQRLYQRFAFTPVTQRDAYWYRFPPRPGA